MIVKSSSGNGLGKEAKVFSAMMLVTAGVLFGLITQTKPTTQGSRDSLQSGLRTVIINGTTMTPPTVQLLNKSVVAKGFSTLVVLFMVSSPTRGMLYVTVAEHATQMSTKDVEAGIKDLPGGVSTQFPNGSIFEGSQDNLVPVRITLSNIGVGTIPLQFAVFQQTQAGGLIGTIVPFTIQVNS